MATAGNGHSEQTEEKRVPQTILRHRITQLNKDNFWRSFEVQWNNGEKTIVGDEDPVWLKDPGKKLRSEYLEKNPDAHIDIHPKTIPPTTSSEDSSEDSIADNLKSFTDSNSRPNDFRETLSGQQIDAQSSSASQQKLTQKLVEARQKRVHRSSPLRPSQQQLPPTSPLIASIINVSRHFFCTRAPPAHQHYFYVHLTQMYRLHSTTKLMKKKL